MAWSLFPLIVKSLEILYFLISTVFTSFPHSEYLKWLTLEMHMHAINETTKIQHAEEGRRKNSNSLAEESHCKFSCCPELLCILGKEGYLQGPLKLHQPPPNLSVLAEEFVFNFFCSLFL